jgi:exosortase D (VPLPA-CTERM-specific)
MHLMGQLSAAFVISWIGFIIAIFGIVLALGGYALVRASFIPIVFLLFAIPLPNSVNSALSLQLQIVSSELGAFFIRTMGIPVYLDGNLIDLGSYKLLIAEACSGLRYIFPLLSLTFLAAYLFDGRYWQRALIFLSGLPIAVVMNGFRIGVLGVLVEYWGPQTAEGALHFFEGWIVFVACAALLMAEMHLLAISSGQTLSDVCRLPSIGSLASVRPPTATPAGPLIACCALIAFGVIIARPSHSALLEPRSKFVEFPSTIGPWHGQSLPLDAATDSVLRADDHLLADYTIADGEGVNFFVAYYGNLLAGKSLHSPSDCIPAGGWKIVDQKVIQQTHPLERAVVEKAGKRLLVYYWFDEQGTSLANEYWANIYRVINSIFMRRSDAALIRLVTEIGPQETEDAAERRLLSFLQLVEPTLTRYVPSARTPVHL